ncbi:hypothetical protein [Methylocapsa acidiphila]|uniref:hypothetical protein n=1 Tax=Methylocapsa acidiphila TaxID=133552 RepID=UPI0012EBB8AB|nr:hypothetical protein [Methylocapsa acidiphila]
MKIIEQNYVDWPVKMIAPDKARPLLDELEELDKLNAEVAVLRDANAALIKDRDRLRAECADLRAILSLCFRPNGSA